VEEYCDGEDIKHEFSSTYTPQQNGVVERKNKTLITLARAMLDEYGVSQRSCRSYQHDMSCFK
jgi:transposase InsO family protein